VQTIHCSSTNDDAHKRQMIKYYFYRWNDKFCTWLSIICSFNWSPLQRKAYCSYGCKLIMYSATRVAIWLSSLVMYTEYQNTMCLHRLNLQEDLSVGWRELLMHLQATSQLPIFGAEWSHATHVVVKYGILFHFECLFFTGGGAFCNGNKISVSSAHEVDI
jgi:hypothetical protein